MKKTKRIAWGITGSGHYLKESMQIIDELSDIDLFLSKAGEEVLKWYDYDLIEYKKKGVKIFKDITASSAPVSMLYEGVYKCLIVSPATSNTVAQMAFGFSDNLITNMFAQAGKCRIPSVVFACDTEPTVITQAPKKMVTLYPRKIELDNFKKLKSFEDVHVVDNVDDLKKAIKEIK